MNSPRPSEDLRTSRLPALPPAHHGAAGRCRRGTRRSPIRAALVRRPWRPTFCQIRDKITHECGIAVVRVLKALSYYQERCGTPLGGFTKLFVLMEKEHNRGKDGAGVAWVRLDSAAGEPLMFRERCVKSNPLGRSFNSLLSQ